MRAGVHATTVLIVGIALVAVSAPAAAPTSYVDECPACALPTADSGILVDFFLGEERVFVAEIGENESATTSFHLSIGRPHQAHVELAGDTVRAYLDGTQIIE